MKLVGLFINKARQAALVRDLRAHGVELRPLSSAAAVVHALKRGEAQAVLLEDADASLIDWLAMLQLRLGGVAPILVVSGDNAVGMVDALAHGATDYADYEDSVEPLLTRLQARVGRPRQLRRMGLEVGPYSLDASASAVRRDDREISLTAREFALAWELFSNAGRVVSASSLTARVWGGCTDICKRTLEQHVYRLRRKLSCGATESAVRIQAVYSIGYRLDLLHEQPLGWAMPDYGLAASGLPLHAQGRPQEQPPGYLRHLWPGEF
ncbi:response regulator transcription factor [Roseateles sp.]|uniref:winged helix-turn-helix transcriptional regulator n=1 Tax=Roseateles sp. TaxID=1971397 RepID=UPI0031DFCF68